MKFEANKKFTCITKKFENRAIENLKHFKTLYKKVKKPYKKFININVQKNL
jgi:hypothetical protein